jgi:hypothetical protein
MLHTDSFDEGSRPLYTPGHVTGEARPSSSPKALIRMANAWFCPRTGPTTFTDALFLSSLAMSSNEQYHNMRSSFKRELGCSIAELTYSSPQPSAGQSPDVGL